jgi:hypothetical protein
MGKRDQKNIGGDSLFERFEHCCLLFAIAFLVAVTGIHVPVNECDFDFLYVQKRNTARLRRTTLRRKKRAESDVCVCVSLSLSLSLSPRCSFMQRACVYKSEKNTKKQPRVLMFNT